MKYTLEMDSGSMIYSYILSFTKFVSDSNISEGGIHIQTHRHMGNKVISKPYFSFYKRRKVN